ncbi:hypothetical protein BJ742DRAFT_835322 [Cladochytrium replicatum]|nr:hypothetical protein BJ742DRAFT_835322 [Cladochytrium replicatum]
MGLAAPKTKQRIQVDPQNKTWSTDKNKFGFRMLQKMGWKEGNGLGVNQQGITEHVKVKFKEDKIGVGADRNNSDNWLENATAYTALLESLHERTKEGSETAPQKSKESEESSSSEDSESDSNEESSSSDEIESPAQSTVHHHPRHHGRLFHRNKFLRNKNVGAYAENHLAEILGVKSFPATPQSPAPSPALRSASPDSTRQSNSPQPEILGGQQTVVRNVDVFAHLADRRRKKFGIESDSGAESSQKEDPDDFGHMGGLGFGSDNGNEQTEVRAGLRAGSAPGEEPATKPTPRLGFLQRMGFVRSAETNPEIGDRGETADRGEISQLDKVDANQSDDQSKQKKTKKKVKGVAEQVEYPEESAEVPNDDQPTQRKKKRKAKDVEDREPAEVQTEEKKKKKKSSRDLAAVEIVQETPFADFEKKKSKDVEKKDDTPSNLPSLEKKKSKKVKKMESESDNVGGIVDGAQKKTKIKRPHNEQAGSEPCMMKLMFLARYFFACLG